jgi:hypothetical protein
MINVLRIWGSTAFDVNLTAARRMVKVVLTAVGPHEDSELAATCERDTWTLSRNHRVTWERQLTITACKSEFSVWENSKKTLRY